LKAISLFDRKPSGGVIDLGDKLVAARRS